MAKPKQSITSQVIDVLHDGCATAGEVARAIKQSKKDTLAALETVKSAGVARRLKVRLKNKEIIVYCLKD